MSGERVLIVNADDFGQSPGINRGIIRAHEQGIVTSATLMVRWPAAEQAAAYSAGHPEFSVGLHLDLGEWHYVAGEWRPRYEVVDTDDPSAVQAEVRRQLDVFRSVLGRDPTHLDSHQHVHRHEPVRSSLIAAGEQLGVPVRGVGKRIVYRGDFYGQDGRGTQVPGPITVDGLIGILAELPSGVTELGCHPGEPENLSSTYRDERAIEIETLCDPSVATAVERFGIRLCSFHDVELPGR